MNVSERSRTSLKIYECEVPASRTLGRSLNVSEPELVNRFKNELN